MADIHVALKDANSVASAIFESSTSPGVILRGQIDEITGRVLVDISGTMGGTGTQYDVSGACNGVNVTFTIPVAVGSDFLLWFERQSQFKTDDYTYVAGVGITTITYVAGHQPFDGATLHRAYVVS